jgi:hypothetical protein
MKKVFSEPEVKIVKIENKDVICDSPIGCGTGENETQFFEI